MSGMPSQSAGAMSAKPTEKTARAVPAPVTHLLLSMDPLNITRG